MSEYQYYEFQTLDRPLTSSEQDEVAGMSSHIDVTSTRATVTYSFGGGFRYDPRQVLTKYFDAFLYLANWGSRILMFRFPKDALPLAVVKPYCREDHLSLKKSGASLALEIRLDEEEGSDWVEGEGLLSSLAHLRNDILEGDYRCLYLAWLKAIELDDLEELSDEPEPPVPTGLKQLSAPLQRFAEFFGVDRYLLQAAAQASPPLAARVAAETLAPAIAGLARQECEAWLLRLAQGEAGLAQSFKRRLLSTAEKVPTIPAGPRRTVAQLQKTAQQQAQAEAKEKADAAERQRLAELKALARREEQTWQEIEARVQTYQAKAYDEATQLLVKLRDLADWQGRSAAFQERLRQFRERYQSRSAFNARLRKVGLV